MGKNLIFILLSCFIITLTSCSTEKAIQFNSIEELSIALTGLINAGKETGIQKLLITRDEYINEIYPATKKSNDLGRLSAEEFWDTMFIEAKRRMALKKAIERYQNRIVSVKQAGPASSKEKYANMLIHARIPLLISLKSTDGDVKEIVDKKLLGVVVEKNGKFRILNVFY